MPNRRIKLWLDDVRDPNHHGHIGWMWVKTYDEALEVFKTGDVERASLDHDLSIAASIGNPAPDEMTGYNVLLWIINNKMWPPFGIKVHSMNPVGRKRMEDLIRQYKNARFS